MGVLQFDEQFLSKFSFYQSEELDDLVVRSKSLDNEDTSTNYFLEKYAIKDEEEEEKDDTPIINEYEEKRYVETGEEEKISLAAAKSYTLNK